MVVPTRAPVVGRHDFAIVVNAERGAILRLASQFKGRVFDATGALEVGFDEVFPKGTVILDLPEMKFGKVEHLR